MFRKNFAAIAAASLVAAGLAGAALAHSVKVGALELTDLWTRATPPQAQAAGGYLTITSTGADADRLVAVASPLAGRAELHEMSVENGTMTMRELENGIEIPAGGSVALAPGGLHIMFMELNGLFEDGGEVPVELTFEQAGTVETFLHVMPFGSGGPQSGHDAGADHDHGGHGDAGDHGASSGLGGH